MKTGDLLFSLSIIVIMLALISIFISLASIYGLVEKLTGRASYSGFINISILTSININLTRDIINWSSGSINSGEVNATLYTRGESAGAVERGNWSGASALAIVVENIGNINCSLSIQTGKNAHDFFNSVSSSNEQYQLNATNKESGACNGNLLGQWLDVNKTSGGTEYCSQLDFHRSSNEIYVDVLLTIPSDAGNIGEQSDTITITGDTAG